jgi:N-acetylglutamate synthase-like GNAT family acetyltransferase
VDYQVRAARITDMERIVSILEAADALDGRTGAGADVLRQLVGLPQASVLVVESHRRVVGAGVLALRPSVAAGANIGIVDVLGADPAADAASVIDALLPELLRSARNKGCSLVEAATPGDPRLRSRWERHGFADAGPRLICSIDRP